MQVAKCRTGCPKWKDKLQLQLGLSSKGLSSKALLADRVLTVRVLQTGKNASGSDLVLGTGHLSLETAVRALIETKGGSRAQDMTIPLIAAKDKPAGSIQFKLAFIRAPSDVVQIGQQRRIAAHSEQIEVQVY